MLKHRVSNTPAPVGADFTRLQKQSQGQSQGQNAPPVYSSTDGLLKPAKDEEYLKNQEGIKRISEKYDSLGNMSTSSSLSPLASPLRSPDRDSSCFVFPDPVTSKFREGVSEQDLLQVDMFYRSHKTDVFASGCLANLYFGSIKNSMAADQWTFALTGIPILVLDTGEHLRERRLHIVLAEKGTGFTLWKDVIDNLTGYKAPNVNFHTLHLSTDHSKLAGLSFDDAGSASEFFSHVTRLTSDPTDELLRIGKSKNKKKSLKEKKKKLKLPKKTEISQPCCFVHVTKLDKQHQTAEQQNQLSVADSGISAPFAFEHLTASSTGSDQNSTSGSLSYMMESKLTLTSSESTSSELSEDRESSSTGK